MTNCLIVFTLLKVYHLVLIVDMSAFCQPNHLLTLHWSCQCLIHCRELKNCRQACELKNDANLRFGKVLFALTRQIQSTLDGVLNGYNLLNHHKMILGLHDNGLCKACGNELETFLLYLGYCPALSSQKENTVIGDPFMEPKMLRTMSVSNLESFFRDMKVWINSSAFLGTVTGPLARRSLIYGFLIHQHSP